MWTAEDKGDVNVMNVDVDIVDNGVTEKCSVME